MVIKNFFLNPDDERLRAGWRIAVFIIVVALILFGLSAILVPLFARFGVVRSNELSTFIVHGSVLAATWGICRVLEKRPLRSVGLGLHERTGIELVQGLLLGALMMTFIFVVNIAFGFASFSCKALPLQQILQISLISIIDFSLVAFGEELLFRGYLFQTLAEGTTKLTAVIVFAGLFALGHFHNPNATTFSLVNIAIAGVFLSVAYLKTRGLWLPIGTHFTWNYFQNNIYSFPVSGMTMADRQLGVLYDNGPAWFTGGAFGPEGGALATVVLIAGTLILWYTPQFRMSPSAWTVDAAPPPDRGRRGEGTRMAEADDAV